MVTVNRLIWDDWNIAHIALHQVTPADVEQVCQGDFMAKQSYGGRILITGPNAEGNLLSVVLAPQKDEGAFYVVTARPAANKERRIYREAKGIDE